MVKPGLRRQAWAQGQVLGNTRSDRSGTPSQKTDSHSTLLRWDGTSCFLILDCSAMPQGNHCCQCILHWMTCPEGKGDKERIHVKKLRINDSQ